MRGMIIDVYKRQALHEPGVLVGGVVHHQIQHDLKPLFVGGFKELVEIRHGPELRHDVPVVADVVAVIIVGGLINGGQPQHILSLIHI